MDYLLKNMFNYLTPSSEEKLVIHMRKYKKMHNVSICFVSMLSMLFFFAQFKFFSISYAKGNYFIIFSSEASVIKRRFSSRVCH